MARLGIRSSINNINNNKLIRDIMKKIIITAVLFVFSTWAAKAADFSALSLTAGLASNTSVFSATAKETSSNEDGGTAGGRIQKIVVYLLKALVHNL